MIARVLGVLLLAAVLCSLGVDPVVVLETGRQAGLALSGLVLVVFAGVFS